MPTTPNTIHDGLSNPVHRRPLDAHLLHAMLAVALLLLVAGTASATPIQVNDTAWGNDGIAATCTLWEAIKTARSAGSIGGCAWDNDPTINLQPDTTYIAQAKYPDITSSISISGKGATIEHDPAAPAARFFRVLGTDVELYLLDLTLTGGDSADKGGAIWIGPGAALEGFRLTLVDNDAVNTGGAIYSRGTVKLRHSVLEGNTAMNGGAISADLGRLEIAQSAFVNNQAGNRGGAILAWPNVDQVTIDNSTFSENEAFRGGAMFRSGQPESASDAIVLSTFKGNRVTQLGEGSAFHLVAPNDLYVEKTALWSDDPASTLCSGNVSSIRSGGHNAATDASCNLDHVEDHPAVAFTLSDLVDHGAWTPVHVPRCDASPAGGGPCSVLIDQYACGGFATIGLDQRGVDRDFYSGNPNDPSNQCDIGAYESICDASFLGPTTFTTLLYPDQYKLDGNILNSGACSGVGQDWQFEAGATDCTVSWNVYFGVLDVSAIWFLDDSQPCPHDCFVDAEACKNDCTLDPNDWKAPLAGLGFNVPSWTTSPSSVFTLDAPACSIPLTHYVVELSNGTFWDPELKIDVDEPPASNSQGSV